MGEREKKLTQKIKERLKSTTDIIKSKFGKKVDIKGDSVSGLTSNKFVLEKLPTKEETQKHLKKLEESGIYDAMKDYGNPSKIGLIMVLLAGAGMYLMSAKDEPDTPDSSNDKTKKGGKGKKAAAATAVAGAGVAAASAPAVKKLQKRMKQYEDQQKELVKQQKNWKKRWKDTLKNYKGELKKSRLGTALRMAGFPTIFLLLTSDTFREFLKRNFGIPNFADYMINGRRFVEMLEDGWDEISKSKNKREATMRVLKRIGGHFNKLKEFATSAHEINKEIKNPKEHISSVTIARISEIKVSKLLTWYRAAKNGMIKIPNVSLKKQEAKDIYKYAAVLARRHGDLIKAIDVFKNRRGHKKDFSHLTIENINIRGANALLYLKEKSPLYVTLLSGYANQTRFLGVSAIRVRIPYMTTGRAAGRIGLGLHVFRGWGEKGRIDRVIQHFQHENVSKLRTIEKIASSVSKNPAVLQAGTEINKAAKELKDIEAKRAKGSANGDDVLRAKEKYDRAVKNFERVQNRALTPSQRKQLAMLTAQVSDNRAKAVDIIENRVTKKVLQNEARLKALSEKIAKAKGTEKRTLKAEYKSLQQAVKTAKAEHIKTIARTMNLDASGNLPEGKWFGMLSRNQAKDFVRFVQMNEKTIKSHLAYNSKIWKQMSQAYGWSIDECKLRVQNALQVSKTSRFKRVLSGRFWGGGLIRKGAKAGMIFGAYQDFRRGNYMGVKELGARMVPVYGDLVSIKIGWSGKDWSGRQISTGQRVFDVLTGAVNLGLTALSGGASVVLKSAMYGRKMSKMAFGLKRTKEGYKLSKITKAAQAAKATSSGGKRALSAIYLPYSGYILFQQAKHFMPGLNGWNITKSSASYMAQETLSIFKFLYENVNVESHDYMSNKVGIGKSPKKG